MFGSPRSGVVFADVAVCFPGIGFKAALSLFWPIPQNYRDARIAAAALALASQQSGRNCPGHARTCPCPRHPCCLNCANSS
jgi:hypothetical protein